MSAPRMSASASALLRALLRRATPHEDRISLTHCVSVDWCSVTFAGQRHQLGFRVTGPDPAALATSWMGGIEEADLPLGRGFVGDIALAGPVASQPDGSVLVDVEALTLED